MPRVNCEDFPRDNCCEFNKLLVLQIEYLGLFGEGEDPLALFHERLELFYCNELFSVPWN